MVASNGDGFFRLAFSTASEEQMKLAAGTIGKVVKEYFQ
jgi:DNA-binding transcriptional MocR family regulator